MTVLHDPEGDVRCEAAASIGRLGLRGVLQSVAGVRALRTQFLLAAGYPVTPTSALGSPAPSPSAYGPPLCLSSSRVVAVVAPVVCWSDVCTLTMCSPLWCVGCVECRRGGSSVSPSGGRALGTNGQRPSHLLPRPLVFATPGSTAGGVTPVTPRLDATTPGGTIVRRC